MSDFEFKPIHKFFKITISSIKFLKKMNSDINSLHVYNNTPYQVTLPLDFRILRSQRYNITNA